MHSITVNVYHAPRHSATTKVYPVPRHPVTLKFIRYPDTDAPSHCDVTLYSDTQPPINVYPVPRRSVITNVYPVPRHSVNTKVYPLPRHLFTIMFIRYPDTQHPPMFTL